MAGVKVSSSTACFIINCMKEFPTVDCQVEHSLLGVCWVSAQDHCRALWSTTPNCCIKIGKGNHYSDGTQCVSSFK